MPESIKLSATKCSQLKLTQEKDFFAQTVIDAFSPHVESNMNKTDLRELVNEQAFGMAELSAEKGNYLFLIKGNWFLEAYPTIKCKPSLSLIFLMGKIEKG
jgi:hypothetical protein